MLNIGLQIYTLREVGEDWEEILKKVAEIGYSGVEMTYQPEKAELIAGLLNKFNLKCTGAHIGLEHVENNWEEVEKFVKILGIKDIIVPWIDKIDTEESTLEVAEKLQKYAKKLAGLGYILSFHNHTAEFANKFNGKTVIDLFFEHAPDLKFEIDCGWAFAAGADVCAVLNKIGDRLKFIHVKDVDGENKPTEVGNGKVNMAEIIETAQKNGVKWGVVEQDNCTNYPALEAVKISLENVKKINK